MPGAGSMDREVVFLRRTSLADALANPGTPRGGFETFGEAQWAHFRPGRPRDISVGGMDLKAMGGTLTVLDNEITRAVSASDRLLLEGEAYMVEQKPWAIGGEVRIEISQAPTASLYAREMEQRGEVALIRRLVPNGSPIERPARIKVSGFTPEEVASGIDVGNRKVMILAEDLEGSGFPLPLRENDKVVLAGGRQLNILYVDAQTHREAGFLNAYQARTAG